MSIKHSTLMRVEEREKKKMDTLKRKLHTEDNSELNKYLLYFGLNQYLSRSAYRFFWSVFTNTV